MDEPRCRQEILAIKPYIPGKPIDEVKRELGIAEVLKLASNENPLGPSPMAVRAMREAVDDVHLYPDGNCYALKQALAEVLKLSPDNLIVGNGSDEIIKLLAETYLAAGEEVIIPAPSFSEYEFAARVMGGACVLSPARDFHLDLDDMAARITTKTKMVFVCNPNNPTGTIVVEDEVQKFLRRVPEDVVVVFDEAYHEYVVDAGYPCTASLIRSGRPNIIMLRTFSKIYGLAGIRIGYAAASKQMIAALNRVREPFNVNALAQVGAAAALRDEEHLALSRENNRRGKEYLYGQFNEMKLQFLPTETNFIWLNVEKDSRNVFQDVLRRGIIIRSGDIFGYENFVRVSIGTEDENEKMVAALREVLGIN